MGHEITPVGSELGDLLMKTSNNSFPTGFMKLDGVVLPECFKSFTDAIENFEVRDDDIWVCSFPKTGTTWTQEMVWNILHPLEDGMAKMSLSKRFPYIELSPMVDIAGVTQSDLDIDISEDTSDSINYVAKLPSPRFIKTHLPFNLLPRKLRTGETGAKIVYIVRNPKDTCISYFHFCTLIGAFSGTLEELCTLFVGDTISYGPFWKHVLGYWEKRTDEKVLFLKFEDMKKDLPSAIKLTATFLGEKLTTDRISVLTERLSFASMKKNPMANNEDLVETVKVIRQSNLEGDFMRSGNIEQWKMGMSSEDVKRFDDWTCENLKDTGLHY